LAVPLQSPLKLGNIPHGPADAIGELFLGQPPIFPPLLKENPPPNRGFLESGNNSLSHTEIIYRIRERRNTASLKKGLAAQFQWCYGFEMQLSAWLDQNKIKRNDFAARIGVSPQAITGWCKGTFWIDKDNAQKIFDETNGEVTPTDLMRASSEAAQ
jgi:hypothetical protein